MYVFALHMLYVFTNLISYILCSVEGEISHDTQLEQIDESFNEVSNASDGVVLCEGTGKSALVLFYCGFACV